MWEFSVFRALGLMMRTLPFVLFRTVVWSGVAVVLLIGATAGAGLGHLIAGAGTGAATDSPLLWGGLGGFLLAVALVQIRRDLILHRISAGHVALMVEALDRRPVPFGPSQISQAQAMVTSRFTDPRALLALDRLVRGVIRTATGLVDGLLVGLLPVALVDRIVRAAGIHLRLALPLLDQVVLAHALRTRSENAWEAAHDGLVLYTQNARPMMANAIWLSLVGWGLAGLVAVALLAPIGTIAAVLPEVPGADLFLALVCGWVAKSSLYDPFATACMLQLHLRLTEEQEPLPEWRGRLTQVSDKFRVLGERALGWSKGVAGDV